MTRITSRRTLPPLLPAPPKPKGDIQLSRSGAERTPARLFPTRVPASWYDYYPASTPDADQRAIIREQDWRTRALADLPDSDELW